MFENFYIDDSKLKKYAIMSIQSTLPKSNLLGLKK